MAQVTAPILDSTFSDMPVAVRLHSPLSTSPAGIDPNVSCNVHHHRF